MTKDEELTYLRKKISPLEDPELTEELRTRMRGLDLAPFRRKFRGTEYYVLTPQDAWGEEPLNMKRTAAVGYSLQALFWERSALNGTRVFVKEVSEYEQHRY